MEYLNELNAGQADDWIDGGPGVGFATPNCHRYDFMPLFWGCDNANLLRALDDQERAAVEATLEEAYM